MEQYQKIRKEMYRVQFTRWNNILNIKSPYTLIKAVYYMEAASLLLFSTQKIIKSPNFMTFLYILIGVVGAILLNSSQESLFYIGLFMLYNKNIFDWADGPLARRLNKTSFLGHALDDYGAYINDMAFRVAFVYYALGYYPNLMFLFQIIAFIILITKFNLYSDYLCHQKNTEHLPYNNKRIRDAKFKEDLNDSKSANGIVKWYRRYIAFLDARSRSIDSLLLILLIDVMFDFNLSILLLSLTVLIILRSVVMYIAGIYYAFNVYIEDY